jgi:type IV pilus assembly protein PilV
MIKLECRRPRARGFTMLEILVALIVTAFGLLGLAKMQALAVSATKESGSRSLIALQAGSLAGAMYANGAFWAAGLAPTKFTIASGVVTDATLGGSVSAFTGCTLLCTPTQMAANDVQVWALGMYQQFPTSKTTVFCKASTTTAPVTCQIYITWDEKQVSTQSNTSTGSTSQLTTQTYSLFVNP